MGGQRFTQCLSSAQYVWAFSCLIQISLCVEDVAAIMLLADVAHSVSITVSVQLPVTMRSLVSSSRSTHPTPQGVVRSVGLHRLLADVAR